MAIYTQEQIQDIIVKNPAKDLISQAQTQTNKLMMHLEGVGLNTAIEKYDYFENKLIFEERRKYTISNKDLFQRLLAQEDMIFTANGGSSFFSPLKGEQEATMNALLSDVAYDLPLRKWMRNFALKAYRADPMGVIFMEVEPADTDDPTPKPRAYPTYKSIYSIYDYLPNGRELEYICFRLTVGEAISFGVIDIALRERKPTDLSDYYRFVDDESDTIYKRVGDDIQEATMQAGKSSSIENVWKQTPGFIISDLIQFNNPQLFVSPLDHVVELADCFLNDRSVRDLQKKYHGFAKVVEPLLQCGTCAGTGYVQGAACPDCTPAGANKGTGYKLQTKLGDVAKFPLEALKEGFDFHKIFGYVTPDIQGWEKQDASLSDLEDLMEMTYWGTARMIKQQSQKGAGEQRTATEVITNNEPRYARLNMTADWAESTEQLIADFIGAYYFDHFEASQISYGRNYVLETPDELMAKYQDMRTQGASETALDDVLLKYYSALYQNNPVQLAICTKLFNLEPFVHLTPSQCEALVEGELDFLKKLYFGEWKRKSVTMDQLLSKSVEDLDKLLEAYVTVKQKQVEKDRQTQQDREIAAQQAMSNYRTDNRIQNAA